MYQISKQSFFCFLTLFGPLIAFGTLMVTYNYVWIYCFFPPAYWTCLIKQLLHNILHSAITLFFQNIVCNCIVWKYTKWTQLFIILLQGRQSVLKRGGGRLKNLDVRGYVSIVFKNFETLHRYLQVFKAHFIYWYVL